MRKSPSSLPGVRSTDGSTAAAVEQISGSGPALGPLPCESEERIHSPQYFYAESASPPGGVGKLSPTRPAARSWTPAARPLTLESGG